MSSFIILAMICTGLGCLGQIIGSLCLWFAQHRGWISGTVITVRHEWPDDDEHGEEK